VILIKTKMSVKNLTFMAFAKGEISSEGANFKRYIGVGSVQLLGISPTKVQLEGILNLKNGATSYDRLEKDVEQAKEAGAYPNTEFRVEPLQEYTVKATNLDAQQPDPANNPFGNPDDNPFFQK
jgi:hypothetical protein